MSADQARQRYRRVADQFGERVRAVPADRWDDPAPCERWVARDVVDHLVTWVPGFLSHFAGLEPAPPPASAADDPAAAWSDLDRQLQGWLDDPSVATKTVETPMGEMTMADTVDRFITSDIAIHIWDLARATGLDDRIDRADIDGMLEGMKPADAMLRESGQYGPRVEVPDDADYQDRLLGFLGRDPNWRPEADTLAE